MKIKTLLWDVDGTLLNTQEGLTVSYRYAIEQCHLPSKTDEELRSYIGPTPQTIFMTHFGLNEEDAQHAADIFRERYKLHNLFKASLYPGVEDVLSSLDEAGIQQAIATNKRQDYATEICEHFGLDEYCSPIVGADNENKLTKADLIKECLKTLKISDSSSVVMIGDTEGDKQAAKAAGIQFLGVNYGFGFHNIPGYANSPEEILTILEEGLNWKDRLITQLKKLFTQSWLELLLGILAAVVIFLLQTKISINEDLKPLINGWLSRRFDLVILCLGILYFIVLFLWFIPHRNKNPFLWAYIIVFVGILLFAYNNQNFISWIIFLLASIPCFFLFKFSTSKLWGTGALGNMFFGGLILFAIWKIVGPNVSMTTVEIFFIDFINAICSQCKTIHDSSRVDILWNHVAFVGSLGVFIYTAFLSTAIKSWWRWVLYFIAGIMVVVTGVSYFHESDPVVQIALFVLFVIVLCSFSSLIANSKERKYPKISERLGRKRAYDRLHAWIRRALKHKEGKAMLLLGSWGTGKTHCLQYLSYRLSLKQPYNNGEIKGGYDQRQYDDDFDKDNAFMGKAKICRVNLWDYSSREEAWNAIVQALGRTILGRYSFLNSITLNKYLPRIMRSLPAGNIFSSLYELFFLISDRAKDEELCEQLSGSIADDERIVLILDDIERTDFQIIKALPPLIEKLHKIERLLVICSLAKDELAKVHKKELNTGDSEELALETLTGYLTKIFDYTFSLPNLSMYKAYTYVNERLRKYSDCKLTCQYLKQSGLNFVTPRQIDRVTEQLGELERQFFYDVDIEELSNEKIISLYYTGRNGLYEYYSCTVFLVEMIRSFYPQFFSIAQSVSEDPVKFAKDVTQMVESSKKQEQRGAELHEGKKEGSKEIQYIRKLTQTDHFAADLIKALKDCKKENVQRAVEGEYKRRLVLTTHECGRLYAVLKKDSQMTLLDGFKKIFGGEESIPEDIDASGLEFFEYVMRRATDAGTNYAKMLLQLIPQGHFVRDEGIKPASNRVQVFTWSVDHFFHLLYLFTEKAPKDKPFDKHFKNVVIQMFDRASILMKYSILNSFFHYQKDKPPQLKDEIEDRLDNKSISVRKVNENEVIEELFKCYVKRYIQGVLKSEISKNVIRNNYYGISNFLMLLVERKDYADILSAEFIAPDIEGIKNSIDVLTLRPLVQNHSMEHQIMMSSERMVDLILPILQGGIDIYGVNAVTSTPIDDWIKNCNESIEYWSKVQTNKDPNYLEGAKKVKDFLEELKETQSSAKEGQEEDGKRK